VKIRRGYFLATLVLACWFGVRAREKTPIQEMELLTLFPAAPIAIRRMQEAKTPTPEVKDADSEQVDVWRVEAGLDAYSEFLDALERIDTDHNIGTLMSYYPKYRESNAYQMEQIVAYYHDAIPQLVSDLLALANAMAQNPNITAMEFEWSYGTFLDFPDLVKIPISMNGIYNHVAGEDAVEDISGIVAEIAVNARDIGIKCEESNEYRIALDKLMGAMVVSRYLLFDTPYNPLEVVIYEDVARIYHKMEDYERSRRYQEIADKLKQGIDPAQVNPVVQFAEADRLLRQGRVSEALPLLEAVFAGREEAVFADPNDLGRCALVLGQLRAETGNLSGALEAYEFALEIFQSSDNPGFEGATLSNICSVYLTQGRYTEALEACQQALDTMREVKDPVADGMMLNNIGGVYSEQGQYEEALEAFQQALTIAIEGGNRGGEGTTRHNIAGLYATQGHYAEALEMYEWALAIIREVGKHEEEPSILAGIGIVYYFQGRYAEAMEVFQKALAIEQKVGDIVGERITRHNIGSIYVAQGHYPGALEMFLKALTIHQQAGNRPMEGITLNNMGLVYHAQRRYTEASEAYRQALTIAREVDNRIMEGSIRNNAGEVLCAQGRYADALEMYQQALTIAREVGYRVEEGITLNNIGLVYHAQGRYTEALQAYRQAMGTVETVRTMAGSELGRAGFIARYAGLYTRAAHLFHQQGQDEEAFFTSERGRARAFLDSLATGYVELSDSAAASLLACELEAYATRQAAQEALAGARALDPSDAELVADLETQLAAAEEEYAAALDAIEARGDQLAALVPGRSAVLGLSEVQLLLEEQTTLLSYSVLEDQTLAFLVTRDTFHTVALDVSREDLTQEVRAFRQFPNLDVTYPKSAVNLYNGLIAPLKEHLTTPHLAIVPHGVLHYLPFAALTDGERYLVDDYVITYLPSASALPFIQENATDRKPVPPLILGNPATGNPDLEPLRYAKQEARIVTGLYGTQPLLEESATETILREQAPQAGVIHLAAHGSYNRHNPLYSAIALAPDEKNDGRLEVHEVYGLNLSKANLVVLSACETQLGDLGIGGEPVGVSPGDEVIGLTRAFFFAGTPSVIASLWKVDDKSTGLLMERFYTHLQAGMGKAEALRQAQLDVREEYPNPYYWSAFVLSGDAGAVSRIVEEGGASGGSYLGLVLICLLVGVVVVLIVKRKRI
jgi:CHAT domain-containing protein/tetratricopeptide (TPR) repeat protein